MADPFRTRTAMYESWFETFEATYQAEVNALEALRPDSNRSLEVGVGTGRFGDPLDISYGIDPAPEMLHRAISRGIRGMRGVGETLPFRADTFDLVVMVTTICFLEDRDRAFAEANRVLNPGGHVLLGFIDRESPVGRAYQESKDENPFYRSATFLTADEVLTELEGAGFRDFDTRQTIFTEPERMEVPDPVRSGTGDGSFVVIRGST